jgi:hypothetical protein
MRQFAGAASAARAELVIAGAVSARALTATTTETIDPDLDITALPQLRFDRTPHLAARLTLARPTGISSSDDWLLRSGDLNEARNFPARLETAAPASPRGARRLA